MKRTPKLYYVYILHCSDGTYYTGSTTDLTRRTIEHNKGVGARYTRGRRPVKVVFYEIHPSYGDALQREHQIKQLTREAKEELIVKGEGS